ncbi:hypothetical protein JNUCC1_02450 [Lentibacillus sp. JNUCC-1]|uniref:LPXTG cell wall anchor domain-containing protein n=1 Tax=Lentibacillus sp. JNUCC-1 TaxID=2654513 RepID=UPI0012E72965|nr:LPXTG cell wall anchor domain-containing protein [Lentibacillus sp. JNUCC-1]MUV38596.1 hypothetical protein [Lentibacillus sp. JNUCC-1]
MKNILSVCTMLALGICVLMLPGHTAFAETEESRDVVLDLSPSGSLFNIENMKPGDWAPRTVTVENNGSQNFSYTMQLKNQPSDLLFDELWLEIKQDTDELYNGKLADFSKVTGSLQSKSQETLDVTIRFPEHLGNEFQGLNTSFSFVLKAEGDAIASGTDTAYIDGMIDSGTSGFKLPYTATSMFMFLLAGLLTLAAGLFIAVYQRKRALKAG